MGLGLADGQLAATSTTILGAADHPSIERVVTIFLFNTRASEETCWLQVSRSGGSLRTAARVVLDQQYDSVYVKNLPLDPGDVLSGYASLGSSVDFLVYRSTGAFGIEMRDPNGLPKQSASVTLTTDEKAALTVGELQIAGLLEQIRDVLYEMR